MKTTRKQRSFALPGLKATSCLTIVLLIFLETVLLSTVSNCAKTFFMHWNTSNSIFRIDNTDHIIDVNKGNLAFEYDQVHIICPVYESGTFDNETEKYIIYNVSKVEYETCRITNANPRIIAICDKPQKLMYFTITFRPFTPQPGGLEFLPGNDYYFISTSSKDDLHRRIGGRCSTNNMKVVFKVCCSPEPDPQNVSFTSIENGHNNININDNNSNNNSKSNNQVSHQQNGGKNNQHSVNGNSRTGPSINTDTQSGNENNDVRTPSLVIKSNNDVQSTMTWLSRNNGDNDGYRHSFPITSTISVQQYYPHPTSSRPFINSAINNNKHNKNNNNNNKNNSNNNYNQSNNAPSHKPTKKTNEYDKHPNEVVKNEELTYNNNAGFSLIGSRRALKSSSTTSFLFNWMPQQLYFIAVTLLVVFFLNYLSISQSKITSIKSSDANIYTNNDDITYDKRNSDSPLSIRRRRQRQIITATIATATVKFDSTKTDTKQCSNGHNTIYHHTSHSAHSTRSPLPPPPIPQSPPLPPQQQQNNNVSVTEDLYKYEKYDNALRDNNAKETIYNLYDITKFDKSFKKNSKATAVHIIIFNGTKATETTKTNVDKHLMNCFVNFNGINNDGDSILVVHANNSDKTRNKQNCNNNSLITLKNINKFNGSNYKISIENNIINIRYSKNKNNNNNNNMQLDENSTIQVNNNDNNNYNNNNNININVVDSSSYQRFCSSFCKFAKSTSNHLHWHR